MCIDYMYTIGFNTVLYDCVIKAIKDLHAEIG